MSEATLEEGASPELAAEVEAFNKAEMEETPPVEKEEAPVEQQADVEQAEPEVDPPEEQEENPFTFKVKGEEKEFSRKQIDSMLNREQTFQQKNNELKNSEEYKMGLLFSAAKGGDETAQKKVKELLSEVADLENLDAVEGEYDVDEKHRETIEKSDAEEPFSDVKDDVDYQETLDKMKESFRERMPSNVYNDYLADPHSRRVMYDLEKSGRAGEVFDALDEELSPLSSLDRTKIKSDQELYGNLLVDIIKVKFSAKQKTDTKPIKEESNLDAVSSGDSSRSVPVDDSNPDWANMSAEDFAKAEKKALKASGY